MTDARTTPTHALTDGTTMTALAVPTSTDRAGGATTLRQLGLIAQWQARRLATWLPLLVVVQVLLSVTTVFGYGLLVGDPPPAAAAYLATGAATVTLVMVGLVMAPQQVAQARTEGSYAWMRTLPVPRWVFLAADLLVWSLVALPGTVLGVVAGAWRFDVDLSISAWIVVAAPLVSLIAATVGYSMATVLPPQVAQLLTQVLVFLVLLFSPISFPAERMPGWLATAHDWLPLEPMADLMRATLMSDAFTMPARSVLVLAAWTAIALFGAGRALTRRT
ncbi:ABC-2 type transporter [Xylanimonas cellulosilytica DSM 15894]|uniref:ABC-2 type transporter n=1 Tax=Xylanimonas cellulosilytica (strain DSM 15894 / JCM 12276 / CECT 5975 / KCTC 9989 / LMG 20990 / NBRC 107835 / XIL07) TaxID=446471 RepID=D1BSG2_XYLCX|nr:ABC transporter permease [Xylanimonas cellulosilytica]ACZ30654.1 ABC-2 type transporter [Xylanimonas cellulosilytica DSM 15894]